MKKIDLLIMILIVGAILYFAFTLRSTYKGNLEIQNHMDSVYYEFLHKQFIEREMLKLQLEELRKKQEQNIMPKAKKKYLI